MAVFLIVSFLPVLGSIYWLIEESVSQAKLEILRGSAVAAQAVEAEISSAVAADQRLMTMLADQPEVKNMDGRSASHLFERMVRSYPEMLNIAAANAKGEVFATAVWETTQERTVADLQFFRHVMLSGWPTVSQTRLRSRSTDLPTAVIAVPIKDQSGMQNGVVFGELSLQELQSSLLGIGSQDGGDIILVDSGGSVLSHPDWRYVATGVNLTYFPAVQAAIRATLQGESGTMERDYRRNGERALIAYAPVRATSWTLMVVRPANAAYAVVWTVVLRSLGVLCIALLVAALIAFVLVRWISKPIDALSARVRGLLDGEKGRARQRYSDELQQLTDAFDSLAEILDGKAVQLADLKSKIDRRNAQLKKLSAEMVRVETEQRKQIAMDVHDGVGQLLATALMEARDAEQYLESDRLAAQEKLRSTMEIIRQVSQEVRCNLFEIRPPTVADGRFAQHLGEYVMSYGVVSGIRAKLEVLGAPYLVDGPSQAVIYRVLQECLHNIRKHAGSNNVSCVLYFEKDGLRLVVRDDGAGFVVGLAHSHPGHLGLSNMRELAEGMGGTLAVESEPGKGTVMTMEMPKMAAEKRSRQGANSSIRRAAPTLA